MHVFAELLTGHDPIRGLGQEDSGISRVGSGGFQTLTDRFGLPVLDSARPARFDPTCEQPCFCAHSHGLLCRPLVLSRASGGGASRNRARTLRRTFGPRSTSVAGTLGSQSCASWLLFQGISFRPAEPRRTIETQTAVTFLAFGVSAVSLSIYILRKCLYHTALQPLCGVESTAQQQPHFKFLALLQSPTGASNMCVCAIVLPVILGTRNTIPRAVQ